MKETRKPKMGKLMKRILSLLPYYQHCIRLDKDFKKTWAMRAYNDCGAIRRRLAQRAFDSLVRGAYLIPAVHDDYPGEVVWVDSNAPLRPSHIRLLEGE